MTVTPASSRVVGSKETTIFRAGVGVAGFQPDFICAAGFPLAARPYPLIPPAVRLCTRYFWKMRASATGSRAAITAPAVMSP